MTPSQILISNAQYFCKKQGIRIQDFEEELGFRRGYLATMFRRETPIDLDRAVKISEKFNIALTEMISCDIQRQERIIALEKELSQLKKEEGIT